MPELTKANLSDKNLLHSRVAITVKRSAHSVSVMSVFTANRITIFYSHQTLSVHPLYDDYESNKAFLHSHTYSGNPLGASVALATLGVLRDEQLCERAAAMQTTLRAGLEGIAVRTGVLTAIRGLGAMVAADLIAPSSCPRIGHAVALEAIKRGVLLRPLGKTLYWLPPLICDDETLHTLQSVTQEAITAAYSQQI